MDRNLTTGNSVNVVVYEKFRIFKLEVKDVFPEREKTSSFYIKLEKESFYMPKIY